MADILIRGMDMPTHCDDCTFYDGIFCARTGYYIYYPEEKLEECPLIEVPDHGDLIDRNALIEDLKRQCKEVFRIDAVSPEDFWINRNEAYRQRLYESWCEGFYEYLGSRPTIIPAEPPKEET